MNGSTEARWLTQSTAATPASTPEMAKAPEITVFARIPMSRATAKSSAAARMAIPVFCRRMNVSSSTSMAKRANEWR